MLEEGKISCKQLIILIFICKVILTLVYLPGLTTPPANEDLWLEAILNFPFYIMFTAPIYFLWRRFPEQTIVQCSQTILGKFGKVVGLLYVWIFIHEASIDISLFNSFLTSAIMPKTPFIVLVISVMFFSAYAVGKGIEVIGRVSEFVIIIFIIMLITIIILSVKDIRIELLKPVMGDGLTPLLANSFILSARTIEFLGFAMLLPYLNDKQKAKKCIVMSYILIIILFIIIDILTVTILGLEDAKYQMFPFFGVVRLIQVGEFLQRIEAIHIGAWILGEFIKVSFYYYLAVLALGQVFNLKSYKPIVVPMGTIIIPVCFLIASNIVELKEFTSYKIFTWYAAFYTLLIPSLLLIIAVVRGKGVSKN